MYFTSMALPALKGFLLLCLLPCWVDSHRNFGLSWRLSKRFKISDERLYSKKTVLRENLADQHEISRGVSSRGKTDGKSHRLAKLLKLEADKKAKYATNSFKLLPRDHYHTSKTTRNENSVRTSTTAVQSSERTNKDYLFRDIVHTDRLNSYAVAPAPKEYKGTKWYIITVATVIILLFVVALCVYAPCACLWRRHRTEFAVNCPITASQKGMCSKCYLHSNAATQKMTYEERPRHVSVTMATSDSQHRPISGNFSAQYTSANATQQPGKLTQAKSKVSNLFKGSQGDHFCEPVRYRYKPLKNPEKRESWTYEPEWTSIGAFLNKNPKSGSYGSTKDSEGRFVDRYGRRSRDSLDAGDVVEYALKLHPRRRQVIELQEFPLGYSKSYLNIDLESDPGVVFDPYRDQLCRKKSRTSERLTFSDSDLRKLSCTDKLGDYDNSEDLFNAARPRKSSLKMGSTRRKAKPKVVHFFPSNFNYDAQFVQIPPKNKMAEPEVGAFEKHFNICYSESKKTCTIVDSEISQESRLDTTKAGGNDEFIRLPENKTKDFTTSSSKEHAVDCDIPSPSMDIPIDETFIPPRVCAGSYVNYGCRSSTEVLTGSKEILTVSMGSQAFQGDIEGKRKHAKNFDSLSSSLSDLSKNDLNYKPEPLAGLLSPVRRAIPKRESSNKGIVTSQAAGDLVCVTSYVQPLSSSKYAVPYGDSIYQPQPDDTTKFKYSQSESKFENDVWSMDKTSIYEPLQRFPEKETKKQS